MITIELISIVIILFILFITLQSHFKEYKEINIIFSGLVITAILYTLSVGTSLSWISKLFNVLTSVSILLIIIFLAMTYINKLKQ